MVGKETKIEIQLVIKSRSRNVNVPSREREDGVGSNGKVLPDRKSGWISRKARSYKLSGIIRDR